MNKLIGKVLRNYNKVILFLLVLIGFSGCEKETGGKAEYGTPHADFIINGKIVSKATNQPISNIRVAIKDMASSLGAPFDSAFSNSEGNYSLIVTDFPSSKIYNLNFFDKDGALNGTFIAKDSIIEFNNPNFTDGDGNWYSGKVTKELNIKLILK